MTFLFGPPNIEKLKAKQDIHGLIKALGYQKDANVREAAAQALGQLGDVQAVMPLAATVTMDPDRLVRDAAAMALGKIDKAQAVELLVIPLKAGNKEFRRNAATALGQITMEVLIVALKDDDGLVRDAAEEALLMQIGDARAMAALLAACKDSGGPLKDGLVLRDRLVMIGTVAVEPLLVALEDRNVSAMAADILGRIGNARAVGPLVVALKHGNEETRKNAATALGVFGDMLVVEPLINALKDSDREVRMHAAEALGKIKHIQAVEPLIVALQDSNHFVRYYSAKALGEIKDKRSVEPLIAALKDADWFVRERAAEALGEINDIRAVEALIVALQDEKVSVRTKAVWALRMMKDERAVEPLIVSLKDRTARKSSHYDTGEEVAAFHSEATKALKALGYPRVVDLKAELKRERLVDELIGELSYGTHHEWEITHAAQKLGKLKDPRAIGPLVSIAIVCKSTMPKAYQAARDALVQIGDIRVVRSLVEWLENDIQIGEDLIDSAQDLFWSMLNHFVQNISPEDLRSIARLSDRTRRVITSRLNLLDDSYDQYEVPITLDFSKFRRLAQKELTRRGLEA